MTFRYSKSDAVWNVEGDCEKLLGVSPTELSESAYPLELLPGSIVEILSGNLSGEPVRIIEEGKFEGLILPCGTHIDVILLGSIRPVTSTGDSLVSELNAGVVAVGPENRIEVWNRCMETLFGVPSDFAVGRKLDEVLQPPLLYSWKTVTETAAKGREAVVQCIPSANRRVTATFSGGGPGVVGTFFDTSESYVTEKRLRTNRRMNQAYFQTIGTGLVLFGEDYRVLSSNRFFGLLFGVSESLVGMPLYEILPEISFSEIDRISARLFSGSDDTFPAVTVRYTSPDGKPHVISQTLRSLKPEEQDVPYVVGIFAENTDAVLVGEDLDRSRTRITSVLELVDCLGSSPVLASGDRMAGILSATFVAKAVAVYFYDPYTTTVLSGCNGSWGDSAPPAEFSELRLPSSVWTTLPGSLLTGHEMGSLEGTFENCFILPLGSGSDTAGFIVAAGVPSAQIEEIYAVSGIVSFIAQMSLLRYREQSEKEQLEFQRSGERHFLETLLTSIDTPVAVFTEEWKVIFWNEAMETVSGLSRTTVTAHPELASERLFAPIGGTSGARKLMRSVAGEPLGSWELPGDGSSIMLRIRRTAGSGQGSFAAAYMVTGFDAADRIGLEKAQATVSRYETLSRGMTDLLSAVSMEEIAGITARVYLAVSGASTAEIRLPGKASAVAESESDPEGSVTRESWKLEISNGSRVMGECVFTGGRQVDALRSFAAGVCLTITEMENRAIGSSLMHLSAASGGRFLFCVPSGAVLFSTWPFSVLRSGSGTDIRSLFQEDSRHRVESMIRRASSTGRAVSTLSDIEGTVWETRVAALSGRGKDVLLLWWPEDTDEANGAGITETTSDLREEMLRFLVSSSGTSVSSLSGVKRSLREESVIATQVQAAIYESRATGRILEYLALLDSAERTSHERFEVDELVMLTVNDLVDGGHRPPDMEVTDDIPPAIGNLFVTRQLLRRVCLMAEAGGSSRLTVALESTARMEQQEVPLLNPWTTDELAYLKVSGSAHLQEPPDGRHLIRMIRDGLMGPPVELGLIRYLMRLTGGDCQHERETGSLTLILPLAGNRGGL
jgi:PAS domain-containing protein